jgi:hypothetical protein
VHVLIKPGGLCQACKPQLDAFLVAVSCHNMSIELSHRTLLLLQRNISPLQVDSRYVLKVFQTFSTV